MRIDPLINPLKQGCHNLHPLKLYLTALRIAKMQNLPNSTATQTMSSLEIAILTEKKSIGLKDFLYRRHRKEIEKLKLETKAIEDALAKISNFFASCDIYNMNAKIIREGNDCFFVSGKLKINIISRSAEDSLLIIDKALAKQNGITLEGKGFIYLVSDGENTKIGATTYNPIKRLNELQVGNAKKLMLIGSYAVERRIATESLLHDKYSKKNIRGEWFGLSGYDIIEIINNRMQSSTNNKYQVLTSRNAQRIEDSLGTVYSDLYDLKIRLRLSRFINVNHLFFEKKYRDALTNQLQVQS